MKRDELREFFFKEGLIRFDEQPCRDFSMRQDFDAKKYQAFINTAGIPATMKRSDVLSNLQLLSKGVMTNTGALLFSKKLDKFFRQASLTCVLFRGTSKSKILDQKIYSDGLVENYHHAFAYLQSHLNTEYIIGGGPRKEVLELPETALREALLNAIAHRDYHLPGHVQVNIF